MLYEQLQEGREEEVAVESGDKVGKECEKGFSHDLQVKTDLHILAAWCQHFAHCNHI